jgi:hypothetical protein
MVKTEVDMGDLCLDQVVIKTALLYFRPWWLQMWQPKIKIFFQGYEMTENL